MFDHEELHRKLFVHGSIDSDMSYIPNIWTDTTLNYFIDKYEVTNKQYKEFIDSGAYLKSKYWKFPFIKDNETLSWEEAMKFMTDKTDRPGPATWQAGDYPEDEDDYPVSGISWYEAAAFAEFAGKELPTYLHWNNAMGGGYFYSELIPNCNFSNKGPSGVGSFRSMNNNGTYDMYGNVREWCYNEINGLRIICGGAWNDPNYTYASVNNVIAFDRSEKNGFRCVKYIERSQIPLYFFQSQTYIEPKNFHNSKTLSDDAFRVVRNQFAKSPSALTPLLKAGMIPGTGSVRKSHLIPATMIKE